MYLQIYSFTQVIEPHWNTLLENLGKRVKDVDDVIKAHYEFVVRVLGATVRSLELFAQSLADACIEAQSPGGPEGLVLTLLCGGAAVSVAA
jgi:hypothetical protein